MSLYLYGLDSQRELNGIFCCAKKKRRMIRQTLPNFAWRNVDFPENLEIFHFQFFWEFNLQFNLKYLKLSRGTLFIPNLKKLNICRGNSGNDRLYIRRSSLASQYYSECSYHGYSDVRAYRNFNMNPVLRISPCFLGLMWNSRYVLTPEGWRSEPSGENRDAPRRGVASAVEVGKLPVPLFWNRLNYDKEAWKLCREMLSAD